MHWLDHRIQAMLAESMDNLAGEPGRAQRRAFIEHVGELVDEIARREGVTAAFASYEGLLVAASGIATDFEAMAAMAQASLVPAWRSADVLELGDLRQMLLVGEQQKLALIWVGPVTLGIVSASEVSLAAATA